MGMYTLHDIINRRTKGWEEKGQNQGKQELWTVPHEESVYDSATDISTRATAGQYYTRQ